jgi:hypothetical protein
MRKHAIFARMRQQPLLRRWLAPALSLAPLGLGLTAGVHTAPTLAGLALIGWGLSVWWLGRRHPPPPPWAGEAGHARSEQVHRAVAGQLLDSMRQQEQALAQATALLRGDAMAPEVGPLLQSCHANQSALATEQGVKALSQTLERVAADMGKSNPAQSLAWAMEALVDGLQDADAPLPPHTLGLLRHAQHITGQLRDVMDTHNRLLQQASRVAKQSLLQSCETSHATRQLNGALKSAQGDELHRRGLMQQLDELLQEMRRNSALQIEIMQSTQGLLDRHATAAPPSHPAALS